MARIPEEEISRIKAESDLVALIQSRGTVLKQQGSNWTGLCPFHDDRRPGSFRINFSSGAFKCFACGAGGGDIIDFVQERYRLDFPESLRLLADRWGVRP